MAGEAKTTQFMLSTATVMIGAMSEVFDLNPTEHSIGLVKNFQLQAQPTFTDLKQGVKNTLVYSVHTDNDVNASMEVYEFTGRNLAYALGLDGGALASTAAETTLASASDGSSSPTADVTLTDASGFAEDDFVIINANNNDNLIVRQIASIDTNDVTFTKTQNQVLPAGAKVKKVNVLRIGSKDLENAYYGAKVAGRLADGTEVVVLFPKIKVVNGFTLAFSTTDYGNLPFEFKLYDSIPSDPLYSDFANEQAKLFMK